MQVGVDAAGGRHAVEHEGGAGPGASRVRQGVGGGRCLEHAREHGRLADGELGGCDAEIPVGGGVQPPEPSTEVNALEVELEDLVLGVAALQCHSEEGFLHFAAVGLLRAEVDVLDELLRERGATLDFAARAVVGDRGPQDGLGVHTDMVGKARVLDGGDGIAHMGGEGSRVDGGAAVAAAHEEFAPIAVEEADGDGARALGDFGEFRHVVGGVHDEADRSEPCEVGGGRARHRAAPEPPAQARGDAARERAPRSRQGGGEQVAGCGGPSVHCRKVKDQG